MTEPKPRVTWEEIKAQIDARKAERSKRKANAAGTWILLVVAILIGGYFVVFLRIWNHSVEMAEKNPPLVTYSQATSETPGTDEPSASPSSSGESGWAESNRFEAYAKCFMELKNNLRNPDSLKEDGWRVSGESVVIDYRAENGFGGTNRSSYICQFDSSGEITSRANI